MSHFYATARGSASTDATRTGTAKSGATAIAASWDGAVRSRVYVDSVSGMDCVRVSTIKWHGSGTEKLLYDGPVNPSLSNMRKYNKAHREGS